MVVIDRGEGEGICVGRYIIRVVEVLPNEVVLRVIDQEEDAAEALPDTAEET